MPNGYTYMTVITVIVLVNVSGLTSVALLFGVVQLTTAIKHDK